MPLKEADAQAQLMDELATLAASVKNLTLKNPLLQDSRYSSVNGRLDVAIAQLMEAQFETGKTPRLDD